jgi:hypothetical protein
MSIRPHLPKPRKAAPSSLGLPIVIFLLGALPVCAITSGPARSEGSVVPWLDRPAPEQPAVQASPAPAQRPCTANDLQIVLGQKGAHHGYATQEIRLTNRGSDKCSFTGFPATQVVHENEAPQSLAAHELAPQLASERLDLDPGEEATLLVGAPGACDASAEPQRKVATRVRVALPNGEPKVLDEAHVDTLCGPASVLRFAPARNVAPLKMKAAAASGPQTGELTGAVTAPETARRGDTLRYTVTLSNPTAAAISLASCPSYTQSLYSEGKVASNTKLLNCNATGGKIAAHSSVSYEIQLPIPAGLPTGDAKLSWVMQNGPGVGAVVTLR